jgi:5-(aminomethyl)-3-furanmethanol phosphate kinase
MMAPHVVKVGGSLFGLSDLSDRLRSWLDRAADAHQILVTGGGALVEQVRAWHTLQPLDEETAHWICIELMDTTARLLRSRMPELALVSDVGLLKQRCEHSGTTIFCPSDWLRAVEPRLPGTQLPVGWETTSDAIAGRLAIALGADELVLLKSALPRTDAADLDFLAETGLVDQFLPRLAQALPAVRLVNLRSAQPWKELRIES